MTNEVTSRVHNYIASAEQNMLVQANYRDSVNGDYQADIGSYSKWFNVPLNIWMLYEFSDFNTKNEHNFVKLSDVKKAHPDLYKSITEAKTEGHINYIMIYTSQETLKHGSYVTWQNLARRLSNVLITEDENAKVMDICYKLSDLYTSSNKEDPAYMDQGLYNLFTFKNAKAGNVESDPEIAHEIFAQWLRKRKVPVTFPKSFKGESTIFTLKASREECTNAAAIFNVNIDKKFNAIIKKHLGKIVSDAGNW